MKPSYSVMKVALADKELSTSYSATIRGRQDIDIYPQVSGTIEKLCVSEGEKVRRGQVLFIIDQVPYKAALQTAIANMEAAKAGLGTAELTYDSSKELYAQKVVSEFSLKTAENTFLTAKAQLVQAEAQVVNARNNLSYTEVKSPTNGVVGALPYRAGALVGPTLQQPLTTVSDNSDMYVQQANPYAQPQQPTQQANPYAQPQQPAQQANQYAQPQQPAQQANPYAQQQQPAQQTNPYINNQSTQGVVNSVEKNSADNDFSQPINPYAPSMTASENLVAPKKRSKKPFIIAGVSVVGVAAVAVAGVMVWNMLKPSGGPITKIADSAKQLAKANSATISASVEANGEKTKCDISYELDASKKEIVLVINGSSSYDSLSSSDTFKSVIYCKDGVRKSATTANGNTTYTEIDEETLNNFFDSINKTNAEQELDWNSLLEDADLKEYIDTTKIDAVSNSLKNTFENGNGKEALGIKESAVDNGTKYSFDINTYKTISIIVDEIEPLFKDKSKYNELKNELPKAESYLNSVNLKFDITVDNAGYLSGFAFNSFGAKIDFSISKIGNTKVELSESEINDIKNAKAEPTTGYIPEATPSAGYMPDKYYWNWK